MILIIRGILMQINFTISTTGYFLCLMIQGGLHNNRQLICLKALMEILMVESKNSNCLTILKGL